MGLFLSVSILAICAVFSACASTTSAATMSARSRYSVEVEGIDENVVSEGLPEGTNVNAVYKAILSNVISGLANKGLTKNESASRLRVKYSISYFGHKVRPPVFKTKYIIGYNIQLLDESSGNVVGSDTNETEDHDLRDVIESVSDEIVSFAAKNVK